MIGASTAVAAAKNTGYGTALADIQIAQSEAAHGRYDMALDQTQRAEIDLEQWLIPGDKSAKEAFDLLRKADYDLQVSRYQNVTTELQQVEDMLNRK